MRKKKILTYEEPEISFDYEVIYSNRKTLAIQVKRDKTVILRAPEGCPWNYLERFLREKAGWVAHQRELINRQEKQLEKSGVKPLSEEEKEEIKAAARKYFRETAYRYADKMGVTFRNITIREQKTRWGSCSSEGNLNFNWRLMLAPEAVREYVVVHELAHRKQMNHSAAFYRVVAKTMPDYERRRMWLKNYGVTLWLR